MRLQNVVDELHLDAFVGTGLTGEPEAFYVPGAALSVDLPAQQARTYVAGASNIVGEFPMTADQVQPIGQRDRSR